MPGKLKTWLCGVALTGAAAMSLAAGYMPPPDGMNADPSRMLSHLTEKLDLNTDQKTSIENLLVAAREANSADHERMRELRSRMMSMRGDFDAGKAREMADEIGQITGRMVYQASETWSQVYQQLDKTQQEQLDGMMAQRGKHRGKWRHGGGKSEGE